MFIDIHVHAVSAPVPTRNGKSLATDAELIQQYDAMGIERGILLPLVSPEAMWLVQSNEEILAIAARHPDRFVPFCNIDPRAMTNSPEAPLEQLLRYYRQRGAKGIGEVTANLPFLEPRVQNFFTHVEAIGFPLIFHIATQIGGCYGLYDEPGLPQLEECLRRFPGLRFIGHSQPFWAEISQLRMPGDRGGYPNYPVLGEGRIVELMRNYPNLYGDLSAGSGHNALARDPEHAVRFLHEFQDRLLFGTDICAPFQQAPLAGFLLKLRTEGRLDETAFRKIARENAVKLLGLL